MSDKLTIALKGQLFKNSADCGGIILPDGADNVWAKNVHDPGEVYKKLNLSGEKRDYPCYSIMVTEESVIYSIRKIHGTRGDCAIIMLRAGGPTNDGKRLIERMNELLDYIIGLESYNDINKDTIKSKLKNCEELIDWEKKPNTTTQNNDSNETDKLSDKSSNVKAGYRTYESDEELYKILEQPYQPAYKEYQCIYVVPSESKPNPVNDITFINSPLETVYYFDFPEGVTEEMGKNHIWKSESFTLIYSKSGYKEQKTEKLSVSEESRYFKIKDGKVCVSTAEKLNLVFNTTVTIEVEDDLTKQPVDIFTIQIKKAGESNWNTSELQGKDGKREVPLADGDYEVSIKADNYKEVKNEINKISPQNNKFTIKLESEKFEKEVFLIPSFAKRNCTEEPSLVICSKNGTFYTKYFSQEKYTDNGENPKFYVCKRKPKVILIIACIISLIVGCSLGAGVGYLKWGKVKPKSNEPEEVIDSAGGNEEPSEEAIPSETNYKNHDVKYLNSNDIWVRDSLQSIKYQYFFDTVLNNKIYFREVSWDKYNEVTNDEWTKIYTVIKEMLSSGDTTKYNRLNFAKMAKDKRIDLKEAASASASASAGGNDAGKRASSPH